MTFLNWLATSQAIVPTGDLNQSRSALGLLCWHQGCHLQRGYKLRDGFLNQMQEIFIYLSVRKVSDLIFLRRPAGFQWSALAWGHLEPSYACVIFSCLSIASVDGKQHLSEIWFPGRTRTPRTLHQWLWYSLTQLTDGEKFTNAYEDSRLPHGSMLHWNPPGFCKNIR